MQVTIGGAEAETSPVNWIETFNWGQFWRVAGGHGL